MQTVGGSDMNLRLLYDSKICPSCGFKLSFIPWAEPERELPCPCCGLHFGYDDKRPEPERPAVYLAWRERWLNSGRIWWSRNQPDDYNPAWQLARLLHLENQRSKEFPATV
jgi:hypothetical protein